MLFWLSSLLAKFDFGTSAHSPSSTLAHLPTRQVWLWHIYPLAKFDFGTSAHSPSLTLAHTRQVWLWHICPLAKFDFGTSAHSPSLIVAHPTAHSPSLTLAHLPTRQVRFWHICPLAKFDFGTSACSPDSTFGTNTNAMHNELNPIVLHVNIGIINGYLPSLYILMLIWPKLGFFVSSVESQKGVNAVFGMDFIFPGH